MLKPCAKCMTLRAKFVRWLGISLGVMEHIKEKQMQPQKTGFTQDEISAIIGAKELELIGLRMQFAAVAAERDALKAKYEPEEGKKLESFK